MTFAMWFFLELSLVLIVILCAALPNMYRQVVAYALFFLSSALSYFGMLGVLTGFNPTNANDILFGVTFLTPFLAVALVKLNSVVINRPGFFILQAINPVYQFTGPFPNNLSYKYVSIANFIRRLFMLRPYIVIGLFFVSIICPSLYTFVSLKPSTNAFDVFTFGIIVEMYVYFNFCGFSMLSFALLRSLGLRPVLNFNQPLGARNVIEYWKRWHISFSFILKTLFFDRIKDSISLPMAVAATFLFSALWHGISINFIAWGVFHSFIWLVSYKLSKYPGTRYINYLIFVIAIIVGRVLSTEINPDILALKIHNIFSFTGWSWSDSLIASWDFEPIISLILAIAVGLVVTECILTYVGIKTIKYEHLRHPVSIALLCLGFILLFTGFKVLPFYGNR